MIITFDTTFWDAIGRLADITWLIAFGSADAWVILAGVRRLRRNINKMKNDK